LHRRGGPCRGCWPGSGFVASIERTAYPRFKRAVPVRGLHEAFTPAAGEIAWAREQTRTPEHLLALVVLLKSCHRLGVFPRSGGGAAAGDRAHPRGAGT